MEMKPETEIIKATEFSPEQRRLASARSYVIFSLIDQQMNSAMERNNKMYFMSLNSILSERW